jgi:flagellin
MSLGVLNNISAIYAENNLNQTQASLQNVLTQLSSGSRINSGADDAAGLSIANGLAANSAALTQSSTNATEGVGLLQVADGALSQVTNLLNRAVTLATEASNGTLSQSQFNAADQEYQSILAEINNVGSTTTYNGNKVFTGGTVDIYTGDATSIGASIDALTIKGLTSGSVGDVGGTVTQTTTGVYTLADVNPTETITGSLTFQEGASGTPVAVNLGAGTTLAGVAAAINAANISGISAQVVPDGTNPADGLENLEITDTGGALQTFTAGGVDDALETGGAALAQTFAAPVAGANTITYAIGTGENLQGSDLQSAGAAQSALTDINSAITDVAAQRGYVGSQINTLNAIANVASTEQENVTSAQNSIQATDYAQASSDLSKYEILSQTGISALAQANSTQQLVTKLLQ